MNNAIKTKVMTVAEIGAWLREHQVPAMAFWRHVAGGDMHPMTLAQVTRAAKAVRS